MTVPNDGIYLFKVYEEATKTPEGRQLDAIKAKAFDDWYSPKKDGRHDHPRPVHRARRPARQEVRCSTRSSPRPGCDGGWIRRTASR